MEKKELGYGRAGLSPQIKDLTADESAFLEAGGTIECEVVNGRWVKRRVGPGENKLAHPRRRVNPSMEMARLKLRLLELGGE